MDSIFADLHVPPVSGEPADDELFQVQQVVEMLVGMIEKESCASFKATKRASGCFAISSSSSSSCSSSSSSTSDDEDEKALRKKKVLLSRKKKTMSSEEEDEDEEEEMKKSQGASKGGLFANYIKTKDELTIDELAPIERLDISVDDKIELVQMGNVLSVVDKLVVVESLIEPPVARPGNARPKPGDEPQPLDEDTVLFDSARKSIGKVFEIFGPVYHPFYSVRFNSVDELKSSGLNLEIGAKVLYAPKAADLTKFIFNIGKLKELKGSDASWNHDQEPPPECVDYSDDEQEKLAKRQLKQQRKGVKPDEDEDEETLEEGEEQSSSETAASSSNPNRFGAKRPFQQSRPFMPKSNSSYSASQDGFAPSRSYQQGRRSFMPAASSSHQFQQARRPQMNNSQSFQQHPPLMQQQQFANAQPMYPPVGWPNQPPNMMMMQYPSPSPYSTPPPFMATPQFYPGNFNAQQQQQHGQFGQFQPYPMMGQFNQPMFMPQHPQMNQFNSPANSRPPIVDKRFVRNEPKTSK